MLMIYTSYDILPNFFFCFRKMRVLPSRLQKVFCPMYLELTTDSIIYLDDSLSYEYNLNCQLVTLH